jgi:hypothetical protein
MMGETFFKTKAKAVAKPIDINGILIFYINISQTFETREDRNSLFCRSMLKGS